MAFGIIEIAMIGIISAVWFGYISKEQYVMGKNKLKEVVKDIKEFEYEVKDDISEVESEVKKNRTKKNAEEKTIVESTCTDIVVPK